MRLRDFDYQIPEKQIAQYPLKDRDSSRLIVLSRENGTFEHRRFRDIADYLNEGDVLILNDTKVMPVRIPGAKPSGGKAEITLLRETGKNSWEALVKGLHEGNIILSRGITAAVSRVNGTVAKVQFIFGSEGDNPDIKTYLDEIGVMPLPLYIKRESEKSDAGQYQTVYAKKDGAVAAPTAGLHFTENLLNRIREKGVDVKSVTLHVGHGTFKPVSADDIRNHRMDEEAYEIPESAAEAVNSAKADGRRVIAVGTTVTRTLESSAASAGQEAGETIQPGIGQASIFIYPGHTFKVIDALITNFHLPGSTPMMLASAFSGLDLLKKSYDAAQKEGYRFYSYGDAMFII